MAGTTLALNMAIDCSIGASTSSICGTWSTCSTWNTWSTSSSTNSMVPVVPVVLVQSVVSKNIRCTLMTHPDNEINKSICYRAYRKRQIQIPQHTVARHFLVLVLLDNSSKVVTQVQGRQRGNQ